MKKFILLALVTLLTACNSSAPTTSTPTSTTPEGTTMTEPKDRLVDSPRHHEWVEVQNGDRTIYTWVVYPERDTAAPAVLVIHENRGLNDWARSLADQVAEAGYMAVAPDLLSGFSDEFTRTSDFADDDAARDALYQLDAAQVQSDLVAVANYAKSLPASNGAVASAGFCWGGSQSFNLASQNQAVDQALVFYGTSPENDEVYQNIDVPVYAFYGEDDERVNATIPAAQTALENLGKTFDYEIYDGAGHAFMRNGEQADADPAEVAARDQAWERMKTILATLES